MLLNDRESLGGPYLSHSIFDVFIFFNLQNKPSPFCISSPYCTFTFPKHFQTFICTNSIFKFELIPTTVKKTLSYDPQTEFLQGLIELQYGRDVTAKLQPLTFQISWAAGWPANDIAFWNAEAFMWSHKIDKETRASIAHELSSLANGKNLDLGCGAYSYLPSVGFDLSPKMLECNDQCDIKIVGDIEQPLPLTNASFDSVTAIFILNYIHNLPSLLREIKRILTPTGTFVAILSKHPINNWQQQKQVQKHNPLEWQTLLKQYFKATPKHNNNLLIWWCR